jgi:sugar phosphate isomerase/epimerase
MNRRTFLRHSAVLGSASAAALRVAGQTNPTGTAPRINPGRISAISDEIAMSPEEAIAFAHHFGLHWLELRDVPALPGQGKPYFFLQGEELSEAAKNFKENGIRISFLNTNLCKNALPDTEPTSWLKHDADGRRKRAEGAKQEYEERFTRLDKCLRASEAFGCPYLRVFSFLRTQDPAAVYERTANVIGEMAERTRKAGFLLLLENEPSCNVGDSAELAQFLKLLPENVIGFNWDARNATALGETPFPDGYNKLPRQRMKNAQIKGHDILDPDKPIDWAPIFAAMDRDGFTGQIGLETHYFDGTKLERSHLAMNKILQLASSPRV